MTASSSSPNTVAAGPSRNRRLRRRVVIGLVLLLVCSPLLVECVAWRTAKCLTQRRHTEAGFWLPILNTVRSGSGDVCLLNAAYRRRIGETDKAKQWLTAAREAEALVADVNREEQLQRLEFATSWSVPVDWKRLLQDPRGDAPEIYAGFVKNCLSAMRMTQALAVLDEWQHLFPEDATCYALRGETNYLMMRWGVAAEAYRQSLSHDPDDAKVAASYGDVLFRLGRYKKAKQMLEKLNTRSELSSSEQLLLATVYCRLNEVSNAEKLLKGILAESPDSFESNVQLGRFLQQQGRSEQALPYLQAAVKQRPESCEARASLGRVLLVVGRPDEAADHMQIVEEAAESLLRLSDQVLQITSRPDDADLRFQVGRTTWKWKWREEGARWLQSVLAIDPQHRGTHGLLAEHYALLGDKDRAAFHRRRAEQ